jgi:class 3 adenylate cyclase
MENDNLPRADPHAGIERRVATIMHADVAGYSRLMGSNEEGTVRVFRGHREIFESLVKMHRGRIFNTAGDALLAEFPSSVEAVRCATEIQAALHTRNEHLPAKERLQFRIGINLGDVIVQGGDLLGDGVNIAARVQTAAEPGGISIAGSVYDQIQNKLTLNFQPMGEKTFKNIAQSIRTYSIVTAESARPGSGRLRFAGAGIAMMLVLAVAATGYWGYQEYSARQAAEVARQATEAAARDAALREQQQAAEEAARRAIAAEKRAVEARRNSVPASGPAVAASPVSRPPAAGAGSRYDGTYGGRICNRPRGDPPKDDCWRVALQVQNGTLTGTWKSGVSGEAAWVKGTITADGAVTALLDSWSRRTKLPLGGSLAGQWADSEIRLSGTWADGGVVSASWKRVP